MKSSALIGLALLALSGCSADATAVDREAPLVSTAKAAVSADPFFNGEDLVQIDPAVHLELEGVDTTGVVLRSLRLALRGDVIVGDIDAEGLSDVVLAGSPKGRRITEVVVVRGDGARLGIGDVLVKPGRDLATSLQLEGHACPKSCSDHGTCTMGRCSCEPGWTGSACQRKGCLNDCSGQGFCKDGQCFCAPGFTGADCSQRPSCPGTPECSGNGICLHGACFCSAGFGGADCSTTSP